MLTTLPSLEPVEMADTLSSQNCLRIKMYLTPHISVQIVGERGGTVFHFRFRLGNAVLVAYTIAMGVNQ